jgi:hypothetical protein
VPVGGAPVYGLHAVDLDPEAQRDSERARLSVQRLARMEEHMSRGNVLMEQIREEHRLNPREHRLNLARFETVRAVIRERVREEMRRGDEGSPAPA